MLETSQVNRAWVLVREFDVTDFHIVKHTGVSYALVKRMRGIKRRVISEGREPGALSWLDVMFMRAMPQPPTRINA
jgi:hypothetical protein